MMKGASLIGLDSKESACNAGDMGLIPGSGRCPGEGNGNPLQYSFLGNSMDRGAGQANSHKTYYQAVARPSVLSHHK